MDHNLEQKYSALNQGQPRDGGSTNPARPLTAGFYVRYGKREKDNEGKGTLVSVEVASLTASKSLLRISEKGGEIQILHFSSLSLCPDPSSTRA